MTTSFDAEWQSRFERFARRYDDEARISGWSEAGLQRRLTLFRSLLASLRLPPDTRALDLGCGAGTYVRALTGLGCRATGLDYSLPTLARAVSADPGGRGRYVAGAGYALPFRAAGLDLVICIGVLQALGEPERALDEMARVLRPGGLLLVEALNGRALVSRAAHARARLRRLPTRVRRYDPRQVEQWLVARGFVRLQRAALHLPPRRLPALGRVLDVLPGSRRVDAWPAAAELTAHAFLFLCRKSTPATARTP